MVPDRCIRHVLLAWCATGSLCSLLAARAAEPSVGQVGNVPHSAYPLWDGHESVEQYAKRTNLPPTKTLDLGGGVNLELVLIPAGKFIMGTPEPTPVDEDGFRKKIVVGQAALAVGIGVLLVLIGTIIVRAIRQRRRPQYSLARLMAMTVVAGVAVMGGMHCSYSTKALAQAQADYKAAQARFKDHGDWWGDTAHEVTLTTPFYVGKYPVTQEQYQHIMGKNPSRYRGHDLPVEAVSWDDAIEFCKKAAGNLSRDRKGAVTAPLADARGSETIVRLPTEAQWEYACRAGTVTTYYSGDTEADLARVAWYGKNSKRTTHPVRLKEPNAWDLYDMHGNVWEWCRDSYGTNEANNPCVDPIRAAPKLLSQDTMGAHVLRGGAWHVEAAFCASASRGGDFPCGEGGPESWGDAGHAGFRVVVEQQR
jgi:formylglycine-generating enzyme required for sulfatase activity